MNLTLFRSTLRSNWTLTAIFTLITLGYLILIISMYDLEKLKNIEAVIEMYPADLMAAVGMDKIPTSLIDFIAGYIYDFLMQLLLIIHVIILPMRLVVIFVERGSMSYLLSTPNSRLKIGITQAVYMAVSLAVMIFTVMTLGIIFAESTHPEIRRSVHICIFFSCLWNTLRYAAVSSTAVLSSFFILTLIGKYGHHKGIYYAAESFSIFQLLQARAIINREINMILNNSILIFIIAAFIAGGLLIF